jgi:hypothetical protein
VCRPASCWHADVQGPEAHAHRALHGRRPGLEEALTVVLSPLAAVRALVRLLGSVLRAHSPLTVASVVCGEPDLLALLRQVYFDDERRREEVEALLAERGLTSLFWAAPSGGGAGLRLFCPRCGTMYTGGVTHCADCRHVGLRAVPSGRSNPHRAFREAWRHSRCERTAALSSSKCSETLMNCSSP